MNKEFKIIEDKLYKFFNKEITNKLKKQIDIITKQIEQVKKDLEEENIDSKVRYKYYEDLAVEREKLLELVDRIELDNGFLEYKLDSLNEDQYRILMLRYKDKKKEFQIAREMNMSQSQVNKIRKKVINMIYI